MPDPARVRDRLRATEASWRHWAGTVSYRGPARDLVVRSALVLKLLTYEPTGALLAAATTSLPERIGGERNFDYRYGWVRDTSFALDALIGLGLQGDVHATLSWLLRAVSGTAPDIRPFYGLRGSVPAEGGELGVRGYRDSRPAHDGNKAVSQPQWGNFGDMLESVWLAAGQGPAVLDPGTARTLERVANRVCDVWARPDSGIWELGTRRHYTISKMACWVALDRLVRLAERGQLSARDAGRWRAEAAAIRSWVDERCWSQARRSYGFYAGSDELDASVLLAGRMGFLPGGDPRFTQTIDAIRGELADGRCCTGTRGPGSRREPSWPARSGSSTPWCGRDGGTRPLRSGRGPSRTSAISGCCRRRSTRRAGNCSATCPGAVASGAADGGAPTRPEKHRRLKSTDDSYRRHR